MDTRLTSGTMFRAVANGLVAKTRRIEVYNLGFRHPFLVYSVNGSIISVQNVWSLLSVSILPGVSWTIPGSDEIYSKMLLGFLDLRSLIDRLRYIAEVSPTVIATPFVILLLFGHGAESIPSWSCSVQVSPYTAAARRY